MCGCGNKGRIGRTSGSGSRVSASAPRPTSNSNISNVRRITSATSRKTI